MYLFVPISGYFLTQDTETLAYLYVRNARTTLILPFWMELQSNHCCRVIIEIQVTICRIPSHCRKARSIN